MKIRCFYAWRAQKRAYWIQFLIEPCLTLKFHVVNNKQLILTHMRLITKPILLALCLAIAGCATPKKILYFQDIDDVTLEKLTTKYEAVIRKDDELKIIVSGPDKTVVAPYNLMLVDIASEYNLNYEPERLTMSYLVDSDGNIDFPVLGRIHVEGMTRIQLTDYLTREIGKDVKDPIVYVKFKNYKITVLGEVQKPGTYTCNSEKVSVLQALGYAGDLKMTARRNGIILIREVDGMPVHVKMDLRNSKIIDSPYYYLQQNDVLYVPPSSSRVMFSNSVPYLWGAIASSVTALIAVLRYLE